ncbi:MAG: hypothetical protein FWG91_06400 [Lachnospiraceae bacterium]|nr:hypothetical protein [Lachnospiraceae bacterium]
MKSGEIIMLLKDEFESNIAIHNPEEFFREYFPNLEFDEYGWFKHSPSNDELYGILRNDYVWICYAILMFFDEDVPYDFYVAPENIYNKVFISEDSEIYHIFDVQIYGENPLHIRIDTFNYKIRVDEGILKED